jgi:hypothetical protein
MRDMAEPLDHVRQQTALHRIVIDDKNMGCHESLLLWTRGTLWPASCAKSCQPFVP